MQFTTIRAASELAAKWGFACKRVFEDFERRSAASSLAC